VYLQVGRNVERKRQPLLERKQQKRKLKGARVIVVVPPLAEEGKVLIC